MKALIELDLLTKEVKLIRLTGMSSRTIINIVCNYFDMDYDELLDTPTPRREEYVIVRKIITLLLNERGVNQTKISHLLQDETVANVTARLKVALKNIEEGEEKVVRPYENIKKLIDDYYNNNL